MDTWNKFYPTGFSASAANLLFLVALRLSERTSGLLPVTSTIFRMTSETRRSLQARPWEVCLRSSSTTVARKREWRCETHLEGVEVK